jgi:hypothetical protein
MSKKTEIANCFLLFQAINEIQLDLYGRTKLLPHHDPALFNKLKNLKANFERESKRIHDLFGEEEILVYYNFVRIFEGLVESASDHDNFTDLIGIIDSWKKGDITVINSREELQRVQMIEKP